MSAPFIRAKRSVLWQAQDDCKWRQIPAFGDWNLWDDMPVTQYFQSGAFFFAAHGEKEDDDLFKVPQFVPAKPYNYKKVRQSHHLVFSNFCFSRFQFSISYFELTYSFTYEPPHQLANNWDTGDSVVNVQCVVRVKGAKESDVPLKKVRRRQYVKEQQKWKPMGAVDEDLYKISPQILCKVKKASTL
jgi:hypothetical protein